MFIFGRVLIFQVHLKFRKKFRLLKEPIASIISLFSMSDSHFVAVYK